MLKTNPQLDLARKFVTETGANIFLTGRAGTGKTTFLRSVVESITKRYVIVAPTGVAALNAGGVTIHSFFQLSFGLQLTEEGKDNYYRLSRDKRAIMRSLELLIIDEISMVRSDLLDAIDQKLQKVRRNSAPFGGVQLLMIGDVRQLSPICKPEEWSLLRSTYNSPYFFDAQSLKNSNYITIELLQIFRQSDREFTELLNSVRENCLTRSQVERLNSRYVENFKFCRDDDYIMLTTHNSKASNINTTELNSIDGEEYLYEAVVEGNFPEAIYPNETELQLKVGAQVIFTKNDPSPEKEFYNGMIATVTELYDNSVVVVPKGKSDEIIVSQATWDNIEYTIDDESGDIKEKVVGSFKQLPIKCAWAITIHKSQGLTFDKVIIDASDSFAHGQVYVALSRCRTFDGIILSSRVEPRSVIDNGNVTNFCKFVEGNQPDDNDLDREMRHYFRSVTCDIFDFEKLKYYLEQLQRFINNNLLNKYPEVGNSLNQLMPQFNSDIFDVSERFKQQLTKLIEGSESYDSDSFIIGRIEKAAAYFTEKMVAVNDIYKELLKVKPTAKELKRRYTNILPDFKQELGVKNMAIELCKADFSIENYQKNKMLILSGAATKKDSKKELSKSLKQIVAASSNDAPHPELYTYLAEWRKAEAAKIDKPLFAVLSNRSISGIQHYLPQTLDELLIISGIGKSKAKLYGDDIIEMVNEFVSSNNIDVTQLRKEWEDSLDDEELDKHTKKREKITEPKEKKISTQQLSFNLYKEGHKVDEIAELRALNPATIYGHLSRYIKLGELNLTDFIPQEKIDTIIAAIAQPPASLSEIKEQLGPDYEYFEMRMVLDQLS